MYVGQEGYWLTNPSFTGRIIESLLHRLEVRVFTHYNPRASKAVVFRMVAALQAEGYADDVAFVIAMKKFGYIPEGPYRA